MGISSVNLMGSSVLYNFPSPPSSSSSSSSSSRVHQVAENEGEDRVGIGMEGKLSDRDRFRKRLGHGAPRLNHDDVENDKMVNSLNRGVEELENDENQMDPGIEHLQRKVLMLMLAKGLKGDELEKMVEDEEILKAMKLNEKLKNLGTGAEERRKRSGKGKVSKADIPRHKVNLNKKKVAHNIEKTRKAIDQAMSVSDGNGVKDEKELSKEIEILEAMLERGSYGMLDLQMMMDEVKAIKGSEKMANEIKQKMTALGSELCELKHTIFELKNKKTKELIGRTHKEEENATRYVEHHPEEEDEEEEDEDNGSKIKWGSVIASVGAVAVAAAAVFFMGRSSAKLEIKSERKRRQNESC